jgi:hypothetical protein
MTTAAMHPGWQVQLAVHRAVRRDIARLSAALDEDQQTQPEAIRTYWSVTASQLHEHHVFEDTVVWPLLGERLDGRVDPLLTRNAEEHQAMAAAMDRFSDAVASLTFDGPSARVALERLDGAVEDHLADEEADVLPLIPEAFTVEDVAAFAAESAKSNPAEVFLPWVLDEAPDADVALFTGQLPAPVRTELESRWLPAWRAKVAALGR